MKWFNLLWIFFKLKEDANFNVLGQCKSLEQTTSLILNELSNFFDKNKT